MNPVGVFVLGMICVAVGLLPILIYTGTIRPDERTRTWYWITGVWAGVWCLPQLIRLWLVGVAG